MDNPNEHEQAVEKEQNPFTHMRVDLKTFRITPRVYAIIGFMLISPILMLGLMILASDYVPALVPRSNVYIATLVYNFPGAAALLLLPTRSALKFIAAAAYWLILSPAIMLATSFASLTFMCLFWGPCI